VRAVDGHRSFPEDPPQRWYGSEQGYSDAEWDRPRADERRYPDEGYRVPEPRSGPGLDPRYDGLTDTQERRYGVPGPFGERDPIDGTGARRQDGGLGTGGAGSLDPIPGAYEAGRRADTTRPAHESGASGFEPSRPVHESAVSGFEPTRSFGDPTITAERTGSFHTGVPAPVGPRSGEPLPPPLAPPMGAPGPGQPGPPPIPPIPEPPRQYAEPIDRAALRRGPVPAAPVGEGVYRTRRPLAAILFAVAVGIFEIPALRLLISGAFADRVSTTAVVAGTFLVIGIPAFGMGLYSLVTGAGRPTVQSVGPVWLRPPVAYLVVGLVLFVAAALAAA
jgi:hypothetical protein